MTTKSATPLILSIALVALVVSASSGCGHGSNPVSTSSQPASGPRLIAPQQFVKAARAICHKANKEREVRGVAFLERRAEETKESLGLVGELEMVRSVVAPSLAKEIGQLEEVGLPKGKAYEAEALWQTLRIVLNEVEVEGIYAWRSAKLLRPFRNRAKPFGLDSCVLN